MNEIRMVQFTWKDKLADNAIESFKSVQSSLPYTVCQEIGMALAKLKHIENT